MSISGGYSDSIVTNIKRLTISNLGGGYVIMLLLYVERVKNAKLGLWKQQFRPNSTISYFKKNNMSARFRLQEGEWICNIFRISVVPRNLIEGSLYFTILMKKLTRVKWVEEPIFEIGEEYSKLGEINALKNILGELKCNGYQCSGLTEPDPVARAICSLFSLYYSLTYSMA